MAFPTFKHRVVLFLFRKTPKTPPNTASSPNISRPNVKSTAWPEPEESIGLSYRPVNRMSCWHAIGPASRLWDETGPQIRSLIESSEEVLEEGEAKYRPLGFGLYMFGDDRACAVPVIIFSSTSRRKRLCAQDLLKRSKILNAHPAVRVKTLDRMPTLPYAGPALPIDNRNIDSPCAPGVATLLEFPNGRQASLTAVLLINGRWYGMTVNHVQNNLTEEEVESLTTAGHDELWFDHEDQQSEDIDSAFMQVTSTGQ